MQEYINPKYKRGRIDGKGGLSAQSIKLHMVVIQQTLKDALRKNMIPSQKFRRLLEQHGLPHIRFHDLCHSCASLLYEMGYDLKDIMEQLGHSDIKMTGNLYAHFNMRQKQGITDSFSANFSAAR